MKFKPYEYQSHTIDFIINNKVAALMLDMGLGKTVITLTAIKELIAKGEVKRVLVIAPLRVAKSTWVNELSKWEHLDGLTYSVVLGDEKSRVKALKEDVNIYIVNRDNTKWLVDNLVYDFNMIVVDELSSFKSYKSERSKALLRLRPYVERIVGLTGTPCSNSLMDLFGEFKVLDLGKRLGRSITSFREKYFVPDKRNANIIFSYKIKPFGEEQIYNKISDITMSMKAIDYLKMPELIINEVKVDLDAKELLLYKKLKKDMLVELADGDIDAVNAAVLSNKLIQMANGTCYDENKKVINIHDKKLDALEDLIEQANGKPILIAYWYKHDRDRIKARFNAKEIFSDIDIDNWNKGLIQVGIIQPQSVGMGVNLQYGGSTLIWYGMIWSLELYSQTNARLWRQGQKGTVIIHHIICNDTIDVEVMNVLSKKEKTQNDLLEAVKAEVRR